MALAVGSAGGPDEASARAGGTEILVVDHPVPDVLDGLEQARRIRRAAHLWGARGAALASEPSFVPEIGAELYVSANTVKYHVKAIYRMLGADGRTDAVSIAQQCGLVATSA